MSGICTIWRFLWLSTSIRLFGKQIQMLPIKYNTLSVFTPPHSDSWSNNLSNYQIHRGRTTNQNLSGRQIKILIHFVWRFVGFPNWTTVGLSFANLSEFVKSNDVANQLKDLLQKVMYYMRLNSAKMRYNRKCKFEF